MNAFYEHHRDNISWHYRCFDGNVRRFVQDISVKVDLGLGT
jgi:hypothetical protein